MRPYEKPREPSSLALIELRKLMGMSQAEFAVKVLDVAPMTVSRLETVTPPHGDQLLRFMEIAEAEALRVIRHRDISEISARSAEFEKIASDFRNLYARETVGKAGGSALIGAYLIEIQAKLATAKQTGDFAAMRALVADAAKVIASASFQLEALRELVGVLEDQHKKASEKGIRSEAKWHSTDARKSGGSSSSSAGSKSAKVRTRKAARSR